MSFSELLKRSLIMSLPGTLSGIGAGISGSDPRQPYKGFGLGFQAAGASSGQYAQLALGQQMDREEREARMKLAGAEYERDTARMIGREEALVRSRTDRERRQAMEDASRFRSIGGALKPRIEALEGAGVKVGLGGLTERDKFMLTADAVGSIIAERNMAIRQAQKILGNRP